MSFQQPWLLIALPLILLPIIIHLINQRRFQQIQWAAMQFLLAAHRMSRGYSRLRQWLIMLARMLVIAGLVFAISRPLSSGWLGSAAGGSADTTIILLDRSPSMQAGTVEASKLETGKSQLVQALSTLGSRRWVVIDGASRKPVEISAPKALLDLPSAWPTAASSDTPLMLQAALDYVRENRAGKTEIWICSDLRESDWQSGDGRWKALRDAFLEFPQTIRFHLLAFANPDTTNIGIRATDVRRRNTVDGAELLVSLRISRAGDAQEKISIPVQFDLEGARSTLTVELATPVVEIKEHPIPIERSRQRGWGTVSIPADSNPGDNSFYFVYDKPAPRKTVIVAEEPAVEKPLAIAAMIGGEPELIGTVESSTVEALSALEWDNVGLLLWQAPLPTDSAADLVKAFVDRGGQVAFFPPRNPGDEEFLGCRWGTWSQSDEGFPIESWRSDEDVLARSIGGAALPVGQLSVRNYCKLIGELTALATLRSGDPLLGRVPTERGGVYFWTTTPSPGDSSLASAGIVLYAFVQRTLGTGAATLQGARMLNAGEAKSEAATEWTLLSEGTGLVSTENAYQAGAYREGKSAETSRLLAVNRTAAEDEPKIVGDEQIRELFHGLPMVRVDEKAGSANRLVEEIWRLFLLTMIAALLLEGILCIPTKARAPVATNISIPARTQAPEMAA